MQKEPLSEWFRHEAVEVLKQGAALTTAIMIIGGAVISMWKYFDFWVPMSVTDHVKDIKELREEAVGQYNVLRRMSIANRLEVLQMRVTNNHRSIHELEDAIAVHQRSLAVPGLTEADREIARRRVIALGDELKWTQERLRGVYTDMLRLREMYAKIPYDPKLGDIDELRDSQLPIGEQK